VERPPFPAPSLDPAYSPASGLAVAVPRILLFGSPLVVATLLFFLFPPGRLGMFVSLGIVTLVALSVSVLQARRTRRLMREQMEAVVDLNEGRLEQATARFDALARSWKVPWDAHALCLMNLASAAQRQGDHPRAIALLGSAARHPGAVGSGIIEIGVPHSLAVTYALAGDLDQARAWLASLSDRVSIDDAEFELLPRALIGLRSGNPREVASSIAAAWDKCAELLTDDQLHALSALKALALKDAGEPFEEALAFAKKGPKGELDWLGVKWPEMAGMLGRAG
jgi:tetratricopeptide (TPR) repeat protein